MMSDMRTVHWRLGGLVALAALGGCDDGSQTPAPTTVAPTTIRNDYHERMSALGELQRSATLRRAIRSSKESCDRVEAARFQGDHENLKMWSVKCKSSSYAVFLAATGDVQVRPCAQAVALKLPPCIDPTNGAAEPST